MKKLSKANGLFLFYLAANTRGGGALPSRIGREECLIILGSKILSKLMSLNLVFCLFKFTFLGSQYAIPKTFM